MVKFKPLDFFIPLYLANTKSESPIGFKTIGDVKSHLRADHGLDPKDVSKNDLFARFHTTKPDGLVQRYLLTRDDYKKKSLGYMNRYWDDGHRIPSAKELKAFMESHPSKEDMELATTFLSSFTMRAHRIWKALIRAYEQNTDDDLSSLDGASEDKESIDVNRDHINHALFDRERGTPSRKKEEADDLAYVEYLNTKFKLQHSRSRKKQEADDHACVEYLNRKFKKQSGRRK